MNAALLVHKFVTKNAAYVKKSMLSLFEFQDTLVAASTEIQKGRIE